LRDDDGSHTVATAEIAADADQFTAGDDGIAIIRPLCSQSVQCNATIDRSRQTQQKLYRGQHCMQRARSPARFARKTTACLSTSGQRNLRRHHALRIP
jgi:hypothetical protein